MRHLVLLLGVLVSGACRESTDVGFARAGVVDLLGRRPDELLQQPGVLTPTLDRSWGAARELGWERWGRRAEDLVYVWSRQPRAYLDLASVSTEDRRISLTIWRPASAPPDTQATVELNGVELGRIDLPLEPGERTLEAPAPLWREGANVLCIATNGTWEEEEREVGFALARVEYAAPALARVHPEGRRLGLMGETGVAYVIEPLTRLQLFVSGTATGSGTLELRLHEIDVRTGEPQRKRLAQSIRLAGQSLERALDLPSSTDGPLRLGLRFRGSPEAHFAFERVDLREAEEVERPPIVFISIDTLAARHLSVYGYARETSPSLEALAADGVVFERCVSNTTWTLPSYMSQMTGLYPYSHRLYPRRAAEMWEMWYLAHNRWTLAESLRAAGYVTAGIVDNDWLTERFGLRQGFDHFDAEAGREPVSDTEGGIRLVASKARDWLSGLDPDAPFFLFLHAFDVHGPYLTSDEYQGRFRDGIDRSRTAPAGGALNAFEIVPTYVARTLVPEGDLPPRLPVEELAAAYDEGIAMVDAELGRFFDHLRERGIYERALIVVSADHGETMASSPFLFGHGVLDEDVLKVPLIVKLPGNRQAGTRVAQTVQLVDLYPTLLELLGRPPREALHGRSLLPLLRGQVLEERPVLSEGGIMRQAALVHGRWKLVERSLADESTDPVLLSNPALTRVWIEDARERHSDDLELFAWLADDELPALLFEERARTGLTEDLYRRLRSHPAYPTLIRCLRRTNREVRYELYDLEADPGGTLDRAAEHPGKVAELRELLRREQARRNEAQRNARPPQAPPELGEEELERLRALGYVGSD